MDSIPVLTYKLLVLALITVKRQQIHNKTAERNKWDISYDFIVVGSGSAGAIVAKRLAERPDIKVLLLEAGGPQNAIYHDIPGLQSMIEQKVPHLEWFYYMEPQQLLNNNTYMDRMGKVIGGSSSHNAMINTRGHRRSYDKWANTYGAQGWSFDEVLPFFKRYENNTDLNIVKNNPGYHSTSGPVQVKSQIFYNSVYNLHKEVYNSLGYSDTDLNGNNQTGVAFAQLFIGQNGLRCESANAYIDPNPYPKTLHIVAEAQVTKILFIGLKAIGIEFVKNGITHKVLTKKEVILSAGPFNSPQILMLSGIGPKNHLESLGIPVLIDLPVGDNFREQPQVPVTYSVNKLFTRDIAPEFIDQLNELYLNGTGVLSGSLQLTLFFSTTNNLDKDWPNVVLSHYPYGDKYSTVLWLSRVRSKGTVRLKSTDPFTAPKVDPQLYANSQDFEDIVDGLSFVFLTLELMESKGYISLPEVTNIGCPLCPDIPLHQCRQLLSCYVSKMTFPYNHPSGTCRMGAVNRSDVVVDPYLRVKNSKNLRVCDSSVFPDLPNSGTNAAAMMVGEKCAQIVKDFHNLN